MHLSILEIRTKWFVKDKFLGGTSKSIWTDDCSSLLCVDCALASWSLRSCLAWPDLAQFGLTLQVTCPVHGASRDTLTRCGSRRLQLDVHAFRDQATLLVMTCLLCWKEVQEGENICCVHWAELVWSRRLRWELIGPKIQSIYSLTYCKLVLGSDKMSRNSTQMFHTYVTFLTPLWH